MPLSGILGDLLADPESGFLLRFRASSVGQLLVGGNAITDKQLEKLSELETRKNNASVYDDDGKPLAKPLTGSMQAELDDLISKRDSEFQFGATATNYIRDCWLKNTYNYDEPMVTNEILKGLLCEDQSIELLGRVMNDNTFRLKNQVTYCDSHFTGTPDIILDDEWVEDIKSSWSLRTFFEATRPDPLYYAQGQVYMALTGRKRFRVAHVLVDTPQAIVDEECKRFYYRFSGDESNPHYIDAVEKTRAMHAPSWMVPEPQRVKRFEFHRDDRYIDTLRSRVETARKIYATLSLGGSHE
jgi:hypothetical protein